TRFSRDWSSDVCSSDLGSISRSLTAACDEYVTYDALPGVPVESTPAPKRRPRRKAVASDADGDDDAHDPQEAATNLLLRALRIEIGRASCRESVQSAVV